MIVRPVILPLVRPLRDPLGERSGNTLDGEIGLILGSSVQRFYSALDTSKFDSLSAVGSWSPSIGSGAATQATTASKPVWSASALNGRPGLTCDGDDLLATSAINLAAFRSVALTFVAVSTNTAIHVPAAFGATDNGGVMVVAREVANRMEGQGRTGGTSSISRASAAPYTSPSVITITVDYDLTTQCARVRKNAADVTTSFDVDTNLSAGSPGNLALNIGNRAGADLGLIGALGAVLLTAWSSAVPTTALADAERSLMSAWGIS